LHPLGGIFLIQPFVINKAERFELILSYVNRLACGHG